MSLKMYKPTPAGIHGVKKIIAVASGKGGVGKSTVAVHLARALQGLGLRVGLMDIDVYGPSARRMLPEERLPEQTSEGISPAECSGIKLISMAHFRQERDAALVRAPIANGLISQFVNEVLWGKLDVLLVDFPPGTGDIQLTICQKAPLFGALIVTTPQKIALMDVLKSVQSFEDLKVPILGIIENMSYIADDKTGGKTYLFGQDGGRYLSRTVGAPFWGQIPIHQNICAACDRGEALCDEVAAPFIEMAKKLSLLDESQLGPQVMLPDPKTVVIQWGAKGVKWRAEALQKLCPCAACQGEGKTEENVEALGIVLAGRYGFRVRFSSGCSAGIYDFEAVKNA